MDFIFRNFPIDESPTPGSLHLRSARPEDRQRPDLATLALTDGEQAFVRSEEGPIRQIVLKADPTLDDMLASTLLERRLEGLPIPEGVAALAAYSGLVREGLRPGKVAHEVSIEGVYLAVRHAAGPDLTDPVAATTFLTGWRRIAACLFRAADAATDPLSRPRGRGRASRTVKCYVSCARGRGPAPLAEGRCGGRGELPSPFACCS